MKGRFGKIGIQWIEITAIAFVCLIAFSRFSESDTPAAAFVKKVKAGGRISAAVQTTDGNYVSISVGEDFKSCIVRKISEAGIRIWERTLSFKIAVDGFVFVNGIAETKNGYVLVGWGRLEGYYSNGSAVMVKLKTDGTVQWSQSFGPPPFSREIIFDSVFSTADGGYLVQGRIFRGTSEAILVKFTSSGKVLWSRDLFDHVSSFSSQLVSDGLILGDQLFDGELGNVRLVKVNDSGNITWKKSLEIEDFSLQILGQASDNGVVLAGKSPDSNNLVLIRFNGNGKLQWSARYLLKVPGFEISSVAQTRDRGYVITGSTFDPETSGNRNGIVLRIDADRNLVFQKFFGLSGKAENAGPVFANADGSSTVFGSSGNNDNDMLILKLNSNGNVPGCAFLHQLRVEKVPSPDVTSFDLTIAPEDLSLPTPNALKVTSVKSGKRPTNACL